jgi:hypothetical protein
MSKAAQISGGQARSLIASFAIDTPWDEINVNVQPFIELPPEQRGRLFAAFIKNNSWVIIGDPKSVITKPFNPTEFIGKGWTTWRGPIDGDGLSGEEDVDPRSLAEVDLAKFIFETCLNAGESSITGEEKLRRLKEKPEFIRFGGTVAYALWLDYLANRKNSILEWIHRNFGVKFMDFMGQVLRSPDGRRDVLCFNRSGDGGWRWDCGWFGSRWCADNPSVGCAS